MCLCLQIKHGLLNPSGNMLKLHAPISNFLAKWPVLKSLSSLVGHQHLAVDETGCCFQCHPQHFVCLLNVGATQSGVSRETLVPYSCHVQFFATNVCYALAKKQGSAGFRGKHSQCPPQSNWYLHCQHLMECPGYLCKSDPKPLQNPQPQTMAILGLWSDLHIGCACHSRRLKNGDPLKGLHARDGLSFLLGWRNSN